jgi:plasmid replication initiation protein
MKKANQQPIFFNLPKTIKKGHQLVFSRQDLSAREADLVALMMAHMKPKDWDHRTPSYEFPCANLSEWLEIDSRHVGSVLAPVAERLKNRAVGIKVIGEGGDTEFDFIPFFKRLKYANGILIMIPNDELRSEYIDYNQGFALINTKNFFNLKREYSKRLYEILSRFKNKGTSMHPQSILDLKGYFGILDERGKLKADKISFKNNSVFMQRCIRESIQEIAKNRNTSKELQFLTSENGDLGFRLIKQGRRIVGIEFLCQWIESTTIQALNTQQAEKVIRELETKRLQSRQRLEIKELQFLADAYRAIDRAEIAIKIEQSLSKRQAEELEELNKAEEETSIESVLNKIDQLKELVGDPGY